MTLRANNPCSNISPIANVKSLASLLGVSVDELLQVAENVSKYWKPGAILTKKDGTQRPTSDAQRPLKHIHARILSRILKKVHYPDYVLGGIADKWYPRDHTRHAALHAGKRVLISEDIKDFFPSATTIVVKKIWQRFFCFAPQIAELLTKLTTHNNALPQGWKTSGYLANLVFWEKESDIVAKLKHRGLAYSRFMDDISISSRRELSAPEKEKIVLCIYEMMFVQGFKPKRKKHRIDGAYKRMEVTGLTVNGRQPSLAKKERDKIRAAVRCCEVQEDKQSLTYKKRWNSASGRVARLTRYHASEGS
ncbi:MAG: reverse transcriptase family protein [Gammaproteobacteria bacterium]|nr:reverse transcriptase family protein [Gammaproteobacteria bacterium]